MRERDFASMVLVVGFCSLTLALWTSPLVQGLMVARTDSQAQARTAYDVDRIGVAMFSWLTDQVGAAAAGQSQVPDAVTAQIIDMNSYPVITHGALETLLVPQYLQNLPELDGWNHSYDFRLNVANPLANQVMGIRSPGRDGSYSGTSYTVGRFDPESFDEDIVWVDGFAVRWPMFDLSDRAAQKKTVEEISAVGAAMFGWFIDQVGFTAKEDAKGAVVSLSSYPAISHTALESLLVPQYIQDVPELDGWGHFYDYRLNISNPLANQMMAIRSRGQNGTDTGDLYTVTSFDSDFFEEDIVWADGSFVRSPAPLHGLSFFSLPPCRVSDTRPTAALQSGVTRLFEIGAVCDIPTSAKAVTVTVTVVGPTGDGYVTLIPAGLPAPAVSTINFAAGQIRSNNAIVGLTADGIGSIEARSLIGGTGQAHLILDVTGFFE